MCLFGRIRKKKSRFIIVRVVQLTWKCVQWKNLRILHLGKILRTFLCVSNYDRLWNKSWIWSVLAPKSDCPCYSEQLLGTSYGNQKSLSDMKIDYILFGNHLTSLICLMTVLFDAGNNFQHDLWVRASCLE
jgi:hypothetical protein